MTFPYHFQHSLTANNRQLLTQLLKRQMIIAFWAGLAVIDPKLPDAGMRPMLVTHSTSV